MDYSLNPSLQQFSVAQIAVELWETKDLREELASFVVLGYDKKKSIDFYDRKVRANKILREVTSKVTHLSLPKCLKTLVTNYLRLVGNQISTTYSEYFSASSGTKPNFDFYLTHLRWTPFGKVDKQKTVESFMNEKCIPITQRYILARIYCCGECDDPDAWQQCSAEMNDFVAHHETLNADGKLKLSGSWKDKEDDLLILHDAMGINFGYDSWCFRDMFCDDTGRVESVAECRFFLPSNNEDCCHEIILCAIEEMNSTQRSKFIQINCAFVMDVLLNDPLRWPQFLESVEFMKLHCSASEFYKIMVKIAEKGNEDFADFNDCRNLFQETWIRTPVNLKTYALEAGTDIIRSLVASEDADSIKLMLNDATDDRLKVRIGNFIQDAFVNTPLYVQKGDFGYITRTLEKVLPSAENIAYVKGRILITRKYYFCAKFISEGKLETLDKFVNWGAGRFFDPIAFKRNLAYVKGLEICHSWIVSYDYFAIDKFVNWCFSSEMEKTEFKMSISQPEVVTSLESGDTEMADIFYNWFFQNSSYFADGKNSFKTVNFAGGYDD